MKLPLLAAAILLLASCASQGAGAQGASVTPAPVIAAERAFAARAGEIGWVPAFREFVAPDGLMPGPQGYVSAPERLAQTPDNGNRDLAWQPAFAGIARSGDIGFTTGPASFDATRTPAIYYFTIWRRQADGLWRWIYDGGPGPVEEPASTAFGAEPLTLPVATQGRAAAADEVNAIEAGAENAGALVRHLAGDAHVYRAGRPRAVGAAAAAALAYPNAAVAYRVAHAFASEAGDLVFTLGEASWEEDGQARGGLFARVWQNRPAGWAIVYDQLIIRRAQN